jgi:HEAT repeat protein
MSSFEAGDGPSVAELIEQLGNIDRLQRVHAAASLVRLGRQGSDVARPLILVLQHEKGVRQKMAALVLGDLAPATREAIPALIRALGDEDEGLRRRAVVALGQFGPVAREAIPALRIALADTDEGVRSFARTALALIEPPRSQEEAA